MRPAIPAILPNDTVTSIPASALVRYRRFGLFLKLFLGLFLGLFLCLFPIASVSFDSFAPKFR